MPRRVRTLLAAAAVTVLGVAGGERPASAQAPQAGFAVGAVGSDSHFTFRAGPGDTRRAAIRLTNLTAEPQTVVMGSADVRTAATGGLDYGTGPARAEGRWVRLDRRRVRLPAAGARTVGFRVRVPRDASPGDHFAGIVAVNERDQRAARRRAGDEGLHVRFLPRLAIAVQSTLPGGSSRDLVPGRPSVEVTPSVVTATLPVRHAGDRVVRHTRVDLALLQGTTVLRRHAADLGAFVPGTDVRLRVPFTGTPARGRYRLVGTIVPDGGTPVVVDEDVRFGEAEATELEAETGREAAGARGPSGVLMALAVGAVALLALAVTLLLRRQRRLTSQLARLTAR